MMSKILKPAQRGFSLIEVLVTLLVISFGLLGFTGLQAYALKSNRVALQRSFVTLQAYSLIDSIRANRVQAQASDYDQDYDAVAVPGTVAGDDLVIWNAALNANLPNGQGAVSVVGGTVQISIRWKEAMSSDDPFEVWSTQTSL